MKSTRELNIGLNRGRRRLWMEGKFLEAAGIEPGTLLECHVDAGEGITLKTFNGEPAVKTRKVSGRRDRMIIDIIGRDIETAFPSVNRVHIEVTKGKIVVTPIEVE